MAGVKDRDAGKKKKANTKQRRVQCLGLFQSSDAMHKHQAEH